jgi:ribosomal protein S18 acetylase RimI-like enzyme
MNSTDVIFRDYRNEDYDEIAKLWHITDMGSPERGDTADVISRTLKLGGKFIVMELRSDHRICGTSWMTSDGRRIFLHHFGILPEYQGKGLSELLLKESLDFVKNTGMQVKLEVHSSNIKAVNLYKKFRFKHLVGYNVYIIRDHSKI